MSYLRFLVFFLCIVVSSVWFVFILCIVRPMLPISLDFPFLIAPTDFANAYLDLYM